MGRILLLVFVSVLCVYVNNVEGIGIAWGRQSTQKLIPSAVVDMLLANGMEKVKFYSLNQPVLSAFSGTNISIMIASSNVECRQVNSTIKAFNYVKKNVTDFSAANNINIKYVAIGNEPYTMINNRTEFIGDEFNSTHYVSIIEMNLGFVNQALQKLGRTDIKAVVPFFTDVVNFVSFDKPSEADFYDDVKQKVLGILNHLNATGAPLDLMIYPLHTLKIKNFPLEFGFFDGDKTFFIKDNNITYTNVFDYVYDSFLCAMRRYGYTNVPLLIGQLGWPTDGDIYANISTAERFYQGLFDKIEKKTGTPLQPGDLDIYLFSLVDENSRSITSRGPTERHYGIYNYDGTPKFSIPFINSKGERKPLESAKGVSYMPRRWCVVDPKKKPVDPAKGQEIFNKTCLKVDCSCLIYGSSCNGMDLEGNLSYAFNMFFQRANQDILGGACDFEGYGKVVNEDPSPTKKCKFPLQILSTIFVGGKSEMSFVLPNSANFLAHHPQYLYLYLIIFLFGVVLL